MFISRCQRLMPVLLGMLCLCGNPSLSIAQPIPLEAPLALQQEGERMSPRQLSANGMVILGDRRVEVPKADSFVTRFTEFCTWETATGKRRARMLRTTTRSR